MEMMNRSIKRALTITLILVLNANAVLPFASPRRGPAPGLPHRTMPVTNRRPVRPVSRRAAEKARPEGQTTTPLPDGRLLLIGGEDAKGPLPSVTLYDPQSRDSVVFPNMQHARAWHSASILPN